tara:strand:+ start:16413 stop:16724 length:312 start_codon:yes stop_codon:yes gene_type:complete
MGAVKIATCCFCGTRAALILAGKERHELSCGSCGAPLHAMKMFPAAGGQATGSVASISGPKPVKPAQKPKKYCRNRPKKKSKFSRLGRKAFDGVWDVIEDIFD